MKTVNRGRLFLIGFGSIAGSAKYFYPSMSQRLAETTDFCVETYDEDANALFQDWRKIGSDIWNVCKELSREHGIAEPQIEQLSLPIEIK